MFAINRGTSNASMLSIWPKRCKARRPTAAQLRYLVGEDAKALMQTRKEIGEESLMGAMRQRFGLAG